MRQRLVALLTAGCLSVSSAGIRPALAAGGHGHAPAVAPSHDTSHAGKPAAGHADDASHPAPPHGAAPAAPPAHGAHPPVAPDHAIQRLADGNARFVAGTPQGMHADQARRCDTFANGQHPFAAVLSCADSRVPVEIVFDAGIGDLFVVRVAGNVADVDEIGTLEYGVEHLGVTAIVVMGHSKCGAVTAVVDKAHVTPNIARLVDDIAPAAESARKAFPQLTGPRLVEKAIRHNVHQAIADLTNESDLLRERVKSGRLKIVGGVYDLHTGEVDWLEAGAATTDAAAAAATPAAGRGTAAAGATPSGTAGVHGHPDAGAPAHAPAAHGEGAAAAPHGHGTDDATAASAPAADVQHDEAKSAAGRKDNLFILGGFLGAAGVTAYGIIHFLKPRGPTPETAPAEAETGAARETIAQNTADGAPSGAAT